MKDILFGKKYMKGAKRHDVRQLLYAKIGAHSAKPAEAREKIVELVGDLPRIELFAREEATGWDAWGDELNRDKGHDD